MNVNETTLVDGLVLSNLDLSEAITSCKDKGFKDEDIIVDVIMCFDKIISWDDWTMKDSRYKNAYELYNRKEYFKEFYYYYEDITRVVRGYPNVHFRHMISPRQDIGGGPVPIFDGTDVTQRFLEIGYQDTKEILDMYFEFFPEESVESLNN